MKFFDLIGVLSYFRKKDLAGIDNILLIKGLFL